MDDTTYVPGVGQINAKIMIVGEAPALEEITAKQPFVGSSGRELDKILKDAGIRRSECWISNVCKYYVPPSPDTKKIPFWIRARNVGIDRDKEVENLQQEINTVAPNIILGLGGTALQALTGKTKIGDYRGSILFGMGRKIVCTYHPAHLLHQSGGEIAGYWQRPIIVFDCKRALAQSTFPEIVRPSRLLMVCKSAQQLIDFIELHANATLLSIDIEAHNCIPICIGIAFDKYQGLCIPLWNTSDISNIPDSDMVRIWAILARLLSDPRYRKIGQNFKYDEDKIRRLGMPIDKLWSDTMLKAFCINPELPKNLAFNTSIYTEEPFYKNEGMYEGSLNDLMEGCARDACVTLEIDTIMQKDLDELGLDQFYHNFLMRLHPLYLDIENHGFLVDESRRVELLKKYVAWDENIRFRLFGLLGREINTSSPKQISELLYEEFKIPYRKGTGEEVLTQLLNNTVKAGPHKEVIELILEDRRVKKALSSYALALPDYDGRMKTTYFLCLETGRTSTGMQEPPIRPTVAVKDEHGKKKNRALGVAFQVMTKHGDIGADVRTMYVADPGYVFLQLDSSQAEARVVTLLADDEETLSLYDTHDFHALTASWFFGGREEDYSKRLLGYESPYRFAGKTLRHAGHLGASKRRAAIELNTQARKYKIDFTITEKAADDALKIFHHKTPKIKNVFQAGIVKCLEKDKRILTAPLPYGIDAPCGGKRIFYERWSDELFRQAFSYIPQRAVSDNTKAAAIRIHERASWIKIVLEAHDALLLAVPISRQLEAAKLGREEMQRPIDFSNCSLPRRNLIIPCDVEFGYNYGELSKFALAA